MHSTGSKICSLQQNYVGAYIVKLTTMPVFDVRDFVEAGEIAKQNISTSPHPLLRIVITPEHQNVLPNVQLTPQLHIDQFHTLFYIHCANWGRVYQWVTKQCPTMTS
jgi:hypothetical protein